MIPIAKPVIGREEIKAISDVLKSGNLVQGRLTKEFEKRFSEYNSISSSIATSNGSTALFTAVRALGLGKGDEVITTPFSFIASSNCLVQNRLKPVFADIDKKTFNIDPEKIESAVTKKTKAVLVVHLYGNPCEMEKIIDICNRHNLVLIEDCCQAHGAEYYNKKVGTFGEISCFSFYATKNMTTGEGGAILTSDKWLEQKCREIINHGQSEKYVHTSIGYNFRMTDMQAALGIVQLSKLDKMNDKRIRNAALFNKYLWKIKNIETPLSKLGVKHVFHQYTIKVKDGFPRNRDQLQEFLNKRDVQTGIHYPIPIHLQPSYRKRCNISLPVSEEVSKEVLSLPVHPLLSRNEVMYIADLISEVAT